MRFAISQNKGVRFACFAVSRMALFGKTGFAKQQDNIIILRNGEKIT
jgi:hypothetical protein